MSHEKGRGLSKREKLSEQTVAAVQSNGLDRSAQVILLLRTAVQNFEMAGSRCKHWCFTWNNYSEEDWDICKRVLGNDKVVTYGIMSHEVGDLQRTRHIQGYVCFLNRQRISSLKKMFDSNNIHWEVMRGTPKEASDYCKKDSIDAEEGEGDLNYLEFGTLPEKERNRNDLKRLITDYNNGASEEQVFMAYPSQWVMYGEKIKRMKMAVEEEKKMTAWKETYKSQPLRPWQKAIKCLLKFQKDRKVLWVVDAEGGRGKTWFGNWMLANTDCQLLCNMKSEAFNWAWAGKDYTVFDFARSVDGGFNYGNIEKAKNGYVYSAKYMGKTAVSAHSKVLVLSNQHPDKSMLSEDRWFICELYTDIESNEVKINVV